MVLSFRHKRKLKYVENKNINENINKHKDRTVLKGSNTGLSLCSSISKEKIKIAKRDGGFLQFLANKDGPLTAICYQDAIQKIVIVGGK